MQDASIIFQVYDCKVLGMKIGHRLEVWDILGGQESDLGSSIFVISGAMEIIMIGMVRFHEKMEKSGCGQQGPWRQTCRMFAAAANQFKLPGW
jgi:hypothetical protein